MRMVKFIGIAHFLWTLSVAQAAGVDVLASRNDDGRTGANLHETLLNVSNVRTSFGKLHAYDLSIDGESGGHVYAQPLYVSNVMIPGRGLTNILLVATTNNFVFAFDADANIPQLSKDPVVWQVNLGRPPSIDDVWRLGECQQNDRHCHWRSTNFQGKGNIVGNVGIISTPVVDRNRQIIFVVSRTILQNPERIVYQLHALDLLTGREKIASPINIEDQLIPSLGIRFNPAVQNQRPGLVISKDHLIVAFGAHEDLMPFRGWVMSFLYRASSRSGFIRTGIFASTPDGSISRDCAGLAPPFTGIGDSAFDNLANECAHGGIWMSGRAPAIDRNGNVLLMTGNGRNDRSISVRRNFGNSLVKLDPQTLSVIDFYTPQNHIYLNDADLDFGGSGPMLIPGTNFIVGGGKQGIMHVWSNLNLGQFRSGDPLVRQKFSTGNFIGYHDRSVDHPGGPGLPLVDNNTPHPGHIMGGPVYWSRSEIEGGARLYNWSEDAELRAYKVLPTQSRPISLPAIALGQEIQAGHPGGILSLSANGGKQGTGIVWASTYDAGEFNHWLGKTPGALIEVRPGILRAYDAETLEQLWTSDRRFTSNGPHGRHYPDSLGNFAKFTPPTISNGRVYMATFSNQIVVYGLLNHRYKRPQVAAMPSIIELLLGDDDEKP